MNSGLSTPPEAFAYFFDPGDVAQMVADWPGVIRLAICLDAGGTCEFVLFHEDEEPRILDRIAAVLGRRPFGFAVSPDVEGYPARVLKFTEETALLKAVRADGDLLERARDYEINYRFAEEEGLDPAAVCLDAVTRDAMTLKTRASVRKIFPAAKRRPRQTAPAGYSFAAPARTHAGEMRRTKDRQRLDINGGGALVSTDRVAFRTGGEGFHVPAAALEGRRAADGLTLEMPSDLFPSGSDGQPRRAEVTEGPEGLFVTPGAPVLQALEPAPPVRRGFTRRLRVPALAGASLLVAGLASAMVVHGTSGDGQGALPTLSVFGVQQVTQGRAPAKDFGALEQE